MSDFYVSVEQIYEVKKKTLFNATSRRELEKEYIRFIELRRKINDDLDEIKERMLKLK